MNFLSQRSTLPELMDDADVSGTDYEQCLADLAKVNRVTLTHHATLHWLGQAIARVTCCARFAALLPGAVLR